MTDEQSEKKEQVFDLPVLECVHCGHKWHPRTTGRPGVCPICKRKDWDRPKEGSNAAD